MIPCPFCNSDYRSDDIGRLVFSGHLGEVHKMSAKECKTILFASEVSLDFMEEAHQWWDKEYVKYGRPSWDEMNIPERTKVISAYSRHILAGEAVDWDHIFDDDTAGSYHTDKDEADMILTDIQRDIDNSPANCPEGQIYNHITKKCEDMDSPYDDFMGMSGEGVWGTDGTVAGLSDKENVWVDWGQLGLAVSDTFEAWSEFAKKRGISDSDIEYMWNENKKGGKYFPVGESNTDWSKVGAGFRDFEYLNTKEDILELIREKESLKTDREFLDGSGDIREDLGIIDSDIAELKRELELRANESNAVGNYTDPAILKEYDKEMEKAEPFYVNQDIRLEPKKSQVGDKATEEIGDSWHTKIVKCPECDGTGSLDDYGRPAWSAGKRGTTWCSKCDGSGEFEEITDG